MIHRASRPGIALLLFLMAATVPALAQDRALATPSQLRELRAEVNRLDDAMTMVQDDSPRAREFRDREKGIREHLEWLRSEVLEHEQDEAEGLAATRADVDSLRREIRSLRDDIDDSIGAPVTGRSGEVDVPDGTLILLRLEDPLSSRTALPEDRVEATVAEPVYGDRDSIRPAIPAGTPVRGIVDEVRQAQRPSKGGRLDVTFGSLALGNQTVHMDARVVDMKEGGLNKRRTGLGALVGGALGAVLDGKKGLLVGALLGGGGAVVASSGEDVKLPAGTLVTVRLERPLRVALR